MEAQGHWEVLGHSLGGVGKNQNGWVHNRDVSTSDEKAALSKDWLAQQLDTPGPVLTGRKKTNQLSSESASKGDRLLQDRHLQTKDGSDYVKSISGIREGEKRLQCNH